MTTNDAPQQLGSQGMRDLLARRGPTGVEEARQAGQLADLLRGKDADIDASRLCSRCRGAMEAGQ